MTDLDAIRALTDPTAARQSIADVEALNDHEDEFDDAAEQRADEARYQRRYE